MNTGKARWARRERLGLRVAVGVGLAVLGGCTTLEYRQIQRDFEVAVGADNAMTASPFTAGAEWYGATLERLTPGYIGKLEPALRPNAWMLRAVSAWRTGAGVEAVESARRGLEETTLQAGSRDAVVLSMIPALVSDRSLAERFLKTGGQVPSAEYAAYAREFRAALTVMREAGRELGPATPESVEYYWRFQMWRLLQNWRAVIAGLAGTADERTAARDEAARFLGQGLVEAGQEQAEAIPAGHELRRWIKREEGR